MQEVSCHADAGGKATWKPVFTGAAAGPCWSGEGDELAEELAGRLDVEAVGDVGGLAIGVTGGGDPCDDLCLVLAGAEEVRPAESPLQVPPSSSAGFCERWRRSGVSALNEPTEYERVWPRTGVGLPLPVVKPRNP